MIKSNIIRDTKKIWSWEEVCRNWRWGINKVHLCRIHPCYLDINDNIQYSDYLEEYEGKINEYNERINLVNETYSYWSENLSIEMKIVGKREKLFLGKIITNKYPWYKPKTKDVIVLEK